MSFQIKNLNPDNPKDGYRIHSELGVWEKKKIDWELSIIAQRELKRASSDANFLPSEYACELWLMTFGKRCPDAVFCVLENIIEPVTPNAAKVQYLFEKDKLKEEDIDSYTANFLRSPLFDLVMKSSDSKLTETSENTVESTEQPENPEKVSSLTSQENTMTS